MNKILVCGKNADFNYNRTKIILNGFEKLDYELVLYSFSKKNKSTANKIKLLSETCQFVFIPSFCHNSVSFIKKHSTKKIVFDPLISKYMTYVYDYKIYHKYGYNSIRTWLRDYYSTKSADIVIFDTYQHQLYFNSVFKTPLEKSIVVPVGSNTIDFFDQEKTNNKELIVGFIGNFIPLHGLENIIKACKIIENKDLNIVFHFIGDGFDYSKILKISESLNLKKVTFFGKKNYTELVSLINNFDICLGIFSENIKSNKVIPNKIFNYAACKKPILTMNSDAINEIFEHNKNIYLCSISPDSIASSIIHLYENKEIRDYLSQNVYDLVNEKYNEKSIAELIINKINSY